MHMYECTHIFTNLLFVQNMASHYDLQVQCLRNLMTYYCELIALNAQFRFIVKLLALFGTAYKKKCRVFPVFELVPVVCSGLYLKSSPR